MVGIYLDASVLVPLIVEEATSAVIQAFVDTHDGALIVSEFASAEVSSAVSRLVRMEQLTVRDAKAALEDFDAWRYATTEDVEIAPGDLRAMTLMVRRFETKLRAADALHLSVARRLAVPIASRDAGLRHAALCVGVDSIDPDSRDQGSVDFT